MFSSKLRKYLLVGTLAFFINVTLLYVFPIFQYLKSVHPESETKTVTINMDVLNLKKEEKKEKKKPQEIKKLVQNKESEQNKRFDIKFGDGPGGSGAGLGSSVGKDIEGVVYKEGQVDKEPVVKRQVMPIYPVEAQNAGIRGKVVIRFVISEAGQVIDARFVSGTEGYGFKEAAIDAIKQWIYEPAMVNGLPVKFEYQQPFNF